MTKPASLTYATREMMLEAYDITHTAEAYKQIDRCLRSATENVESLTHRVFYPENKTLTFDYLDWFNPYGTSWILRLNQHEVTAVTAIVSGGDAITDYFLRPDDGAPFTQIEVDLSSSQTFSSGETYQRAISVTGTFGYREDSVSAGTLIAGITSSATSFAVSDGSMVGVGDLLLIEDERMVVSEKNFTDSTATIAADVTSTDLSLTLDDGTLVSVGEILLVDAERMRITAISGNTVVVLRAWDGSSLATHTSGATVSALRQVTVVRGVLGTTGVLHATGTDVSTFSYPSMITDLTLAEAMVSLTAQRGGYIREAGINTDALDDLRERVYRKYGRKARSRAV